MSEWIDTTLGDVVTLQRGFDLPKNDREAGPFQVIASTGAVGSHNEAMVQGPGVVIGRSGSLGGGQYVEKDFWPLNTTLWVKDFKDNDRRFCYYLLKSLDLARFNAGSGVPTLNRNHIHPMPVSVPAETCEQRAIAHILGTLDDKIELNRRMNETLEAMARAIFKSWFVDFDPVRAKAAGRDPGLPKEIADLFPDSFEDSELGKIPKGWQKFPFPEAIEIISGGTPKTSAPEYWDGDIPWFSVVDAPNQGDVFVINTERKITPAGIENSAASILPVGTTIISARGTVGKLAIVGTPMAMNQSCYGLSGLATGTYFTYFATKQLITMLKQRSHGSVFATITRDTMAGIDILVPARSVLEAFERLVSSQMERVKENLEESRTLATLRDTLLPKLISGELRVPINEAQIPSSACD
ncbi:MAG: restriction endonuclease subunit S [Thermoleophilia bacterium]